MAEQFDNDMGLLSPFQYLEHWAQNTPNSPALVAPSLSLSFSQLHEKVEAMAFLLADKGIKAGQLVVTTLPSEVDWIVTLALTRLGASSMSLPPASVSENSIAGFDFAVTWEIAPVKFWPESLTRIVLSNQDLLPPEEEILASSDPFVYEESTWARHFLAEPQGSGQQVVQFRAGTIQERIDLLGSVHDTSSLELHLGSLSCWWGYSFAVWTLQRGGVYLCPGEFPLAQDAAFWSTVPFEVLSGPAKEVSDLISLAAGSGLKLGSLSQVTVSGHELRPALANFLTNQLGLKIFTVYGFAEIGFAFGGFRPASAKAGFVGSVLEGCRVQLTGKTSGPLLPGEVGKLKVKSDSLFDGYLGEKGPADVTESFFETTDFLFVEDGQYFFAKDSEPTRSTCHSNPYWNPVVELVRSLTGVVDCALVPCDGLAGETLTALAVVGDAPLKLQELLRDVKVRYQYARISLAVQVRMIPRDITGSVITAPLSSFISEQIVEGAKQAGN